MTYNKPIPILVGGGQVTQRDVEPVEAAGPLDLMEEAVRRALENAETNASFLDRVDAIRIVQFLSGDYTHPAEALRERLGVAKCETFLSNTGGDTPQSLVNQTAEDLAQGRIRAAILCGGEALHSTIAALKSGAVPKWMERDGVQPNLGSVDYEGTAEWEIPYHLQLPVNVYPLFENALRAHHGWSLDDHRRRLGELCSAFTEIAAENPYAWFQNARTAEDISTPGPQNRHVGFPYTKLMNAMIRVDQAAAVLMTTTKTARALGIPESRWVYLHGCANAQDHWYVTHRENFRSSPAIRTASRKAFEMAGWEPSDLDYVDLYSCFPSAVQFARDEIGLSADGPPLTVTGGLPYFGGPANNYAMHSIATMMDLLRESPGAKGLCTALGWYITKHAVGLYSTEPLGRDWIREDPESYQREVDEVPKVAVAVEASGAAVVETYTVIHGHDGPEEAIVAGRLDDNRRFLAKTPKDADIFTELMTNECVGRRGTVKNTGGPNEFRFLD